MTTADTVQKLYVTFFNRPADVAGLAFWSEKINSGVMTESQIAAAFVASDEYHALYHPTNILDLIASLYQNLFSRPAVLDEALFWGARLEQGLDTFDGIAARLATSAQGTDAVTLASKVAAAQTFTAALNTTALAEGYSGLSANFTARAWLTTVVDAASFAAATTEYNLSTIFNTFGNHPLTFTTLDDAIYDLHDMHLVTVRSIVEAGSVILLKGIDDYVLAATGSAIAPSTATQSTVIDGGAGTDMVSARLINAGNAAEFKNFELLNLDSAGGLDVSLLKNSVITGLTMATRSASATYAGLSKEQSLAGSFNGDNHMATNVLQMTDVSGDSDTYTIRFNTVNFEPKSFDASYSSIRALEYRQAGTVAVDGVENFKLVSDNTYSAALSSNSITLGADASAETVVVTGWASLSLSFAAGFGSSTTGHGVSSISASAAAGRLSIDLHNVSESSSGLTVEGGSAADTFIVSTSAVTVTGGAGADTFDIAGAIAGSSANPLITTITDASAGEHLVFHAGATTEAFVATKLNVVAADALLYGSISALNLAAADDGSMTATIKWFQDGGNTYIVEDMSADAVFTPTDLVVKLNGLIDLSAATYDATTHALTLA